MAFNLRTQPSFDVKHQAYPYQLDAVRSIKDLDYAAIFHEQGLGKTKIAIDLFLNWLIHDIVDTIFIVTKKSLVANWLNEIKTHTHLTPRVLSTNRRSNSIALNSPVLVYVLNYEVVSNNEDIIRSFLQTCRVAVILDESQKIKNPGADLSKAFLCLSKHFRKRVIMTGTPVANRPYDLWSQIFFLDRGDSLGHDYTKFKKDMDVPTSNRDLNTIAAKLESMNELIRDFSVRETKSSSGIKLPDKTIETHFVLLSSEQSRIYNNYREQLRYEIQTEYGQKVDDAEAVLKRLLRLVQCASNPRLLDPQYREESGKLSKLRSMLKGIISSGANVIVWTGFIENVEFLVSEFYEYRPAKLHGRIPIEERNLAVETFKGSSDCTLLIATPGAAKEGLTLTNANQAIFYDRSFSLDDYLQAQDRIHRISQEKDCFVHNLIAKDTIDEWIDLLLNAKYRAASLAQGDITQSEFQADFNFDLSELLGNVLNA